MALSNSSSLSARVVVPHSPLHSEVTPVQVSKPNVLPVRPSLLEHRMELLTAQVGQLRNCGLE